MVIDERVCVRLMVIPDIIGTVLDAVQLPRRRDHQALDLVARRHLTHAVDQCRIDGPRRRPGQVRGKHVDRMDWPDSVAVVAELFKML